MPPKRSKAAVRKRLLAIYDRLRIHFGHRDWWPGDTRLEICVGAVLTQNTAWKNVERAIANLKQAEALSVGRLLALPLDELAQLIRPAGYYNLKARRLRAVLEFLAANGGADFSRFADWSLEAFRGQLLAVYGVGPETADSILLYAFDRPTFVIDAYTRRIFARLGLSEPDASYENLQRLFMSALDTDAPLFNDYHAQIVALGHHICRPAPHCEACPLESLCEKRGVEITAASPGPTAKARRPRRRSRSARRPTS
ncbi:MAG: endonuclease III domain-containing protein [Myxococcales bacterium]|nr:MAG: endonuclease III domain-containing protein [Myxococcales bacterium]